MNNLLEIKNFLVKNKKEISSVNLANELRVNNQQNKSINLEKVGINILSNCVHVNNEIDLLEYYRKNNKNLELENRDLLAEKFKISARQITRYNRILRSMGKIRLINNKNYLVKEEN